MDLRVTGLEGSGLSWNVLHILENAGRGALSEPSRKDHREGQRLPEGQPGGSQRQSGA